jgi:integrase
MKFFNLFKRSPSLKDFFQMKYEPQRLLSGSPKTKDAYFVTINRLSQCLGTTARLNHLNDENLAAFVKWRRETTKVKESTIARDMVQIKALWRFARDLGLLKLGPTVKTVAFVTPPPKAYTEEHLHAIHAAIQLEQKPVLTSCKVTPYQYVPGPIWWSALLLVLWDTAERIGAVMELREMDVDFENATAFFRADTRKGRQRDNIQPLEATTLKAIKLVLSHYSDHRATGSVFRWAANRSTMWNRFGKILERAGVPVVDRKKFHMVRSSRATHEHILGGDATAKLTHQSNAVTRKAYLDASMIAKLMRKVGIFQPGQVATPADQTPTGQIMAPASQPLMLTHDPTIS